ADRRSGDYLESADVDHGHHFVAAGGEENLVFRVDGQASGAVARGERSAPGDFRFRAVDLEGLARSFDIDVDLAGAIDGAEFRRGADWKCSDHVAGFGIDSSSVIARVIDGEDALIFGLVADRVRVDAGFGFASLLQSLQVEGDGGVFAATANEAFVQLR